MFAALLVAALFGASSGHAVEAVNVRTDVTAIDLTGVADLVKTESDTIQVSAAPGRRRHRAPHAAAGARGLDQLGGVRARQFRRRADRPADRRAALPHGRLGPVLPDLGLSRIVTISPSSGERPEQQYSATADIYRVTLDPGTVVTYIAELRTDRLPQLYLWEPDAYKDKINSFTLYYGIVIGIAGLLALFLTILFVVKGSVMFPAAAALGWAVLVYIGIDFGFWGKVFDMSSGAERIWRASGEAILAGTLLVFLFAYLNLGRWHVRYMHITMGWLAGLAALVAIALIDASIASGIARLSLVCIAFLGFGLVIYLSTHGYDRAVLLIPTWFCWWSGPRPDDDGDRLRHQRHYRSGAARRPRSDCHADRLHRDAACLRRRHHPQHRYRRRKTGSRPYGAGDMIWDWDVSADRVYTSPETEQLLGLSAARWTARRHAGSTCMHALDRDRFRAALDGVLEQRRGRLVQDFRLRTPEGHYLWFALKARPVVGSDGEVVRLVGTLTDVTEFKTAEERLLHDAVHDNLTGLPNRQLFIDRLEGVMAFAKADPAIRATVVVIDLDRFKQVNDSVGIAVGDSILLTLARRLGRLLKPQDTLARLTGDQFAMILLSERDPTRLIAFAETIRRTLRAPITFNDREFSSPPRSGLHLATASRTAPRRCSRTPSSRCITPSGSAATASSCSSRRCGRARPTG
jgi:diguanylate cyclase (GGDEF)-like protein/PAS domain S-box-containing protein